MKYFLRFFSILALSAFALMALAANGAIPPPEKAFPASATSIGPNLIAVRWDIKPGFYLYAGRFAFNSKTPGISLGKPELPPATIKHDPFLGEEAVFIHPVIIRIPLQRRSITARTALTLTAIAQGCKVNSVCYPPFTQNLRVDLPSSAAKPVAASRDVLASLAEGSQSTNFLPPNQAFQLHVEVLSPNHIKLRWTIAPGYHLYRNQMRIKLAHAPGLRLGQYELPPGKIIHDAFLGRLAIYPKPFSITIPILRATPNATIGALTVRYQGCANKGICYPPITKNLTFNLAGSASIVSATKAPLSTEKTFNNPNEQGHLARFLLSKPLWMSLGLFFLLGLGLAFTPCVFPMIPILSGIIVGQKKIPTARRAFVLTLVYVLAMALTYTVVGVIVGLTGASVQSWLQNPWALTTFALILVLLALSMFGLFELQMPNFIQGRLTQISNRQRGGTLLGVAIMGFLSALIVGPCITAPLTAALLVIANTGNALLGGLGLFSLGLGMGAPLLVIGTLGGEFLPRAGIWMNAIKDLFGILLLAVAIWMVSRFLPDWATALLSAFLIIGSGIYLGALEPIPVGRSGWSRLWKTSGFIFLFWGCLILIGIAAGGNSLLTPLQDLFTTSSSPAPRTGMASGKKMEHFHIIHSLPELRQALAIAKGHPVLLDFYADWCVSCKELDAYTFSNPAVKQALSRFVLLRADVTADTPPGQALLQHFGLFGPPGIIFFLDSMDMNCAIFASLAICHLAIFLSSSPEFHDRYAMSRVLPESDNQSKWILSLIF